MSRKGLLKTFAPLDALVVQKRDKNIPVATQSVGNVGRWDITSFASVRGSDAYALSSNGFKENMPSTSCDAFQSTTPTDTPKSKKIFKSRISTPMPQTDLSQRKAVSKFSLKINKKLPNPSDEVSKREVKKSAKQKDETKLIVERPTKVVLRPLKAVNYREDRSCSPTPSYAEIIHDAAVIVNLATMDVNAPDKKIKELASETTDVTLIANESLEIDTNCVPSNNDLKETVEFPKFSTPSVAILGKDIGKKVDEYPEFTNIQKAIISQAMVGHPDSVLVFKFNASITRRDILTLQWYPLVWLNNEVIDFYMKLLTERGQLRSSDGYPKVYAMNTGFTQRLCSGGYSAIQRWTKNVDIFACDIIPVPVYFDNVHWCMAIIHMKEKTIKYYDSMGGRPNRKLLSALKEYLRKESLDKRKTEFDFSGWITEHVKDNPQQQNGSDCGVFSCMTAEFICRNRPIVFDQQHMIYFRQKMVLEICAGQMLL